MHFGYKLGIFGSGVFAYDYLSHYRVRRAARVAALGCHVIFRYKFQLSHYEFGSERYKQERKLVNEQLAKKLRQVCLSNKGIYTKLGQHIASLNHVIPVEITSTLAVLQDQATPVEFAHIEKTITKDLKMSLEDIFEDFDKVPVAAASLAQVHKGRLKDGRQVAVKVQYPSLEYELEHDLKAMRTAVKLIKWSFKGFDFEWILPEFVNALTAELDFECEKNNADRVRNLFADDAKIYVPKMYEEFSSKRVLCMEYIHGVKVNDANAIRSLSISPKKIASMISDAFGKMIFRDGFLHCDPHPGNLLVRKCPTTDTAQLVLLDHGLYRQLDDSFRKTFCDLYVSLLNRDQNELDRCSKLLHVQEYASYFPLIFTFRPMNDNTKLGDRMQQSDRDAVKKHLRNMGKYEFSSVNQFMEYLPRDMLFVFRVSNLVRSLNLELGGTSRDRFWIMGRNAIQGSTIAQRTTPAQHASSERPSYLNYLKYTIKYYQLYANLYLADSMLRIYSTFSPKQV